jgi:large subunit ribosomal protein L9
MKVILLKDVPKIGRKYDIKEVNDGYAMNFLVPKKLADLATPRRLAEIEAMKKTIQIEKAATEEAIKANLAKLNGLELVMKAKSNEQGHLFKSIHKDEIIEKMKKDYHIEIAEEFLMLDKPVKETGEYELAVSAASQKAKFKLIVEKI